MSRPVDPEGIHVSYEGTGERYATRYRDDSDTGQPYVYPSTRKSTESLSGQAAQMPFTLQPPRHQSSSSASIQPLDTSYPTQQFPKQLEKETVQAMSQSMSQKSTLITPEKTTANTYLPLAIIATILFCPLTGAAAIFYSLRSRDRLKIKHIGAAEGYGCISLCFSIISITIGLIIYITLIVFAATRIKLVPWGYGNGDRIG